MLSRLIGKSCKAILDVIVGAVSFLGVNPNFLTFVGFIITIFASVCFAKGKFVEAGFIIILAGIFDMLDGRVARITNSVTKFGAFFDSVLDRYSDIAMFLGLMIYYSKAQRLIYEELARVRYLAGNGFRLLFGSEPVTAATWKKITADADQSSDIIAANLLSRRKP